MRRALLIGIDDYPVKPLSGCVNDVKSLRSAIEYNGDGKKNFDVKELPNVKNSKVAMAEIIKLFEGSPDIALLYFSGHGCMNHTGAELVFPDDYTAKTYYVGLQMRTIMDVVNRSKAKHKIIILDCCKSGGMGKFHIDSNSSELQEGVTILSACRENESAAEVNGQGLFTKALCYALNGAAADYTGKVSIGSVYSCIDRYFSLTEQRPVFKSNEDEFTTLRTITPRIGVDIIKDITKIFTSADELYSLNPSYEFTNDPSINSRAVLPHADKGNVSTMKKLQKLERIGLVEPIGEEHMYFAAMNSKSCSLTQEGKFYWQLAKKGLIQ